MSWGNMTRTIAGQELLAQAMNSGTFVPRKIVMGDGTYTGSFQDISDVVSSQIEITDINVRRSGHTLIISGYLSNSSITTGFYFRELALYASLGTSDTPVCYAYNNCGTDAEYISRSSTSLLIEKCIQIQITVANSATVNTTFAASQYVLSEGGELEDTVLTFTEAASAELSDLTSGSTMSMLFGKLKKLLNNMYTTLNGKSDSTHLHDDRYYTESEMDTALSGKLDTSASLALGETSSTAYRGDRGKVAYDHSQTAHAPSDATKTTIANYTATITPTWTGSTAPYSQELAVMGIVATDTPLVDLIPSETYAAIETEMDDWGKIYRIVCGENKLTVYATDTTSVSLSIKIKVVK